MTESLISPIYFNHHLRLPALTFHCSPPILAEWLELDVEIICKVLKNFLKESLAEKNESASNFTFNKDKLLFDKHNVTIMSPKKVHLVTKSLKTRIQGGKKQIQLQSNCIFWGQHLPFDLKHRSQVTSGQVTRTGAFIDRHIDRWQKGRWQMPTI